jgi:hypothetical protein
VEAVGAVLIISGLRIIVTAAEETWGGTMLEQEKCDMLCLSSCEV